jgi:hypothetical protein
MHPHDAILHFAPTAAPLPLGSGRVGAALGRSRLVDQANGLGVGVLTCHDVLATLAQSPLIPLDGFKKSL